MSAISERDDQLLQESFEEQAYTPEEQAFLRDFYGRETPGVLADHQIQVLAENAGMVTPFVGRKMQESGQAFSWGLGEDSYDARLGRTFKILKDLSSDEPIDPRRANDDLFETFEVDKIIIPANGFVLGVTMEALRLPSFIRARVNNKSTVARLGVDASFTTDVRPGSRGLTTLEIKNRNQHPITLRAEEGIVSLIFEKMSAPVQNGYHDGRYAGQSAAAGPSVTTAGGVAGAVIPHDPSGM